MAKMQLLVGSTSNTINIFIQDSSSTVGAGLAGLVYNTAGLTAYYALPRAAPVAITLATQTVTGAFSSGGFVELDATHTKGLYRLDIPDAAVASGRFANIYLYGATNMAPVVLEIELTATNNQDAVHGGMSALPNTACTTNASLITSGTSTDQLQVTSGGAAPDWAHIKSPTTTVDLSGTTIKNVDNAIATVTTVTNQLTAAQIATGVWQDTTAGDFTTASSVGKSLMNGIALGNGLKIAECVLADTVTTYTGNTPQTGDAYARLGAPAGASVSVDVAAIKADTVILKSTIIDTGTAQSGGASLIQLRAGAPDLVDIKNKYVVITGGAGAAQVRALGGWTNGTKTVTVNNNFAPGTDNTSTYAIFACGDVIGDGITAFPAHFSSLGIDASGAISLVTEVTVADALTTNNDKTGYSLAVGQIFIKKNVQLANFTFVMTDSTTHAPKTGVTVTATRSIDGAAFGACANAVTEIANGWYKITLAAADVNGTVIALRFTGASADDKDLTVITQA